MKQSKKAQLVTLQGEINSLEEKIEQISPQQLATLEGSRDLVESIHKLIATLERARLLMSRAKRSVKPR
jgi:hypothetical protein